MSDLEYKVVHIASCATVRDGLNQGDALTVLYEYGAGHELVIADQGDARENGRA